MSEPKIEHTKIEAALAREMRQDIHKLAAKCYAEAATFLSHPEWYDEAKRMKPPTINGKVEGRLYEKLIPPVIERIEATYDKAKIKQKIRKAFHHIREIIRVRETLDDLTPQAVESHKTDFAIERRELEAMNLPPDCYACLDFALAIALASQEADRSWRQHAQFKQYVEINEAAQRR